MSAFSLGLDASEASAAIDELGLLSAKLPLEVRPVLFHSLNSETKFFRIDGKFAVGASQVVSLKPTDCLSDLLSALRAWEFDKFRIKITSHAAQANDSAQPINRK